jgi:SAM-dependent methyltransferase
MDNMIYKNYTTSTMFIGFEEIALTEWSLKYIRHLIVPHLPHNKDAKILELGCGYGRYVHALGMLEYIDVNGIDISEEQINYAKEVLGLRNVQLSDAIQFLDSSVEMYDVIVMMDVLEHLDVQYSLEIIQKIHGRLNIGGKLIVQVPNAISPLSVNRYGDITHKRAYSARSMEQSMRIGGFTNINCYPLPPFSWDMKSFFRSLLWRKLINPLIGIYLRVAVGGKVGGIYTENLLCVSIKT